MSLKHTGHKIILYINIPLKRMGFFNSADRGLKSVIQLAMRFSPFFPQGWKFLLGSCDLGHHSERQRQLLWVTGDVIKNLEC